jgi:hypothetical protein
MAGNITLRVRFHARFWLYAPGVQDFAAALSTNKAAIRGFVPELVDLTIQLSPELDEDAQGYIFAGELAVDQASTLGQFIWTGRPTGGEGDWECGIDVPVFPSIGIITDRIFCVPHGIAGIASTYKLFLDEIIVEKEGEEPLSYIFEEIIRDSGGSKGL